VAAVTVRCSWRCRRRQAPSGDSSSLSLPQCKRLSRTRRRPGRGRRVPRATVAERGRWRCGGGSATMAERGKEEVLRWRRYRGGEGEGGGEPSTLVALNRAPPRSSGPCSQETNSSGLSRERCGVVFGRWDPSSNESQRCKHADLQLEGAAVLLGQGRKHAPRLSHQSRLPLDDCTSHKPNNCSTSSKLFGTCVNSKLT
jgi:hypothetical protein